MLNEQLEKNFEDLGLDINYVGKQRFINRDGSYNIKRIGTSARDLHLYQFLLSVPFYVFLLLLILTFFLLNICFGSLFYACGASAILGADTSGELPFFVNCFFLSIQTFTTVGYGTLSPNGIWANAVATLVSLSRLIYVAMSTGLVFARFSRPNARINFSRNILIRPTEEEKRFFMFRIVNARSSPIVDVEAQLVMTWIDEQAGVKRRKFKRLPLRINKISLFPLNWTINHVIDDSSPLHGITLKEMKQKSLEVLVVISGFDEALSKNIQIMHSYGANEILDGYNFKPMFETDKRGLVNLHLKKLNDIEAVVG